MKIRPAEQIVEFLSVSPSLDLAIPDFRSWSEREWVRTLQWMDDAGLALYFLQRAKERNAIDFLPEKVTAQLESNFSLNQKRTADLWGRFRTINARFSAAGIPFVVLKGFSLVPQFCPSSELRHQGDFDYLVDASSLGAAGQLLEQLGYTRKRSQSSQEEIFLSPGATAPSRGGRQYSPTAPHAVELHLDVWDAELFGLPDLPELFSTKNARTIELRGSFFPALGDEDAFLLQIVHACFHIFTHWIRMSCLLEISWFLAHRVEDKDFWNRVEQRVSECTALRDFVAIVAEVSARLFHSPIPSVIRKWSESMRPEMRLWLEWYSRDWVFADIPVYEFSLLPKSKLVLFLQKQFQHSRRGEDNVAGLGRRDSRISRMFSAAMKNPGLLVRRDWWRSQRLFRRSLYHGLAELRYICEYPRWRWRLRDRTKPAPSRPSIARGLDSERAA